MTRYAWGLALLALVGCSSESDDNKGSGGSGAMATGGAAGTSGSGGANTGGTAGGGGSAGTSGSGGAGGSVSPDKLPLIDITDLQYEGALRLPASDFGISSLNYSQGPIAYDAKRKSIYIVGHDYQQAIAEFAVPALTNSTTLTDLKMAGAPTQTFASMLDRVGSNPNALDKLGGMAVLEGANGPELLVHAFEYYDAPADNTQTTLVVRDPTQLGSSKVDGFYSFAGAAHTVGWISPIPNEWQSLLGGKVLTGGSSGWPIIGRLSVGPSAFVFDAADVVGNASPPGNVSTTALLDFSLNNPLDADLSNDSGTNDLWTHLSRAAYGFIAPGTRTYVTLGSSGGHASGVCYKCTPSGASQPCGGYCSKDGSDYDNYFWFWDVNDLVKVKQGALQPHAVKPYAHGKFATPFSSKDIGGGSFDPGSGLLYLTLQHADDGQGQYNNPPVVLAYSIKKK
ncbi:MAG: hypothetical protein R3B13_20600 [Polyangiaceae bacterium]